jgi:CRISPR-associated protein Cas5h
MGFLGAVGGLATIEEYKFLNSIQYAVKINHIKGKENFCFNGIKDALPSVKKHQQHIKQRKQFYRELLIRPSYKLFIDFSTCMDESKMIRENLKNHISLYQPYMGINFCLANFEFKEEYRLKEVNNNEMILIDSAISLETKFEIELDKSYSDIRMATTIEGERIFGGFKDMLIELNGRAILARPPSYIKVDRYRLILI